MNLNSIVSSPWRLRRRLTRSNGADARIRPTSCYPLMVCTHAPICSHSWRGRGAKVCSTDKTIKLWKVFEKNLKVVAEGDMDNDVPMNGTQSLRLPKMARHDTIVAAVPRKIYSNGDMIVAWMNP